MMEEHDKESAAWIISLAFASGMLFVFALEAYFETSIVFGIIALFVTGLFVYISLYELLRWKVPLTR